MLNHILKIYCKYIVSSLLICDFLQVFFNILFLNKGLERNSIFENRNKV